MKNQLPDIYLEFDDDVPDEFIGYVISDFYREDLNLQIHKRQRETYASFEWIYPTIIVANLLTSYFDGFIKEFAKDHYLLLKNGLKKMAGSGKLIDSKMVAATESTQKLSKNITNHLYFHLSYKQKTINK